VEHNGDDLILPRHLADQTGLSASEYSEFSAERNPWLRAHGVDPGKWKQVHPISLASWSAYGIERGALQRSRRLRIGDPDAVDARQVLRDEVTRENRRRNIAIRGA
jgi:hypothetical protein